MRLIVEYNVGDGHTWYATETVPVIYESAEAFIVDFEEFVKDKVAKKDVFNLCKFAGREWDITDFYKGDFTGDSFYWPRVYTVDEFFAGVES